MFIFEREKQCEWGGAEGQRGIESKAGSRFWVVSTEPDTGLEPTNREIKTWAEVGHLTNWATQTPLKISKLVKWNNLYNAIFREPIIDLCNWKHCNNLLCFCFKRYQYIKYLLISSKLTKLIGNDTGRVKL